MPSGSRMVTAFGAYTSGSRHREQSFIVTSDGAERAEIAGRRPLGDRRALTPDDVLKNVMRNLSKQDEKESALSMIERASSVRRGTIQKTQATMQEMEARAANTGKSSAIPDRLQERRIQKTLTERLPGIVDRLRRNGEIVAQVARAGATFIERIARDVRRRSAVKREEYWASTIAKNSRDDRTQQPKKNQGRRRR